MIPSKTNPTSGEEDHMLSQTLNSMPALSESLTNWSSLNHQISITSLKLDHSTICEAHPHEAFVQLNCPSTIQGSDSSTPAHTSSTWEPGNSKGDVKVGEVDEQEMGEMADGEGVTMVLCAHSPPIQLPATHEELVTMPARTPALSSVLLCAPMSPNISNPNPNLKQGCSV